MSFGSAVVRHALGLTRCGKRSRRWSYRNHYVVGLDDGMLDIRLYEMIEIGMLRRGERLNEGRMQALHVTNEAIEFYGLNRYVRREDRIS